jgi:hypothetical protein
MTTRAASLSAWFDDCFGSTADQDARLRCRLAAGLWVVYDEPAVYEHVSNWHGQLVEKGGRNGSS